MWNTLLVGAGYLLGDQWCSILGVLGVVEDVVIVLAAAVAVLLVVRWVMRLRASRGRKDGTDGR